MSLRIVIGLAAVLAVGCHRGGPAGPGDVHRPLPKPTLACPAVPKVYSEPCGSTKWGKGFMTVSCSVERMATCKHPSWELCVVPARDELLALVVKEVCKEGSCEGGEL